MSTDYFPAHTTDSAPASARAAMTAVAAKMGGLPAPVALMSTSPELLQAFLRASALFEHATLDGLSREVVVLTIAVHNDCHVCIGMHTSELLAAGGTEDLATALRDQQELHEPRFEALRTFTLTVMSSAGKVDDDDLRRFIDAGYTPRNALEVVLAIGTYTLSTFANRMTMSG